MNTNQTLFDAAACTSQGDGHGDGRHVGAQLFAARTAGGHALEDIAHALNIRAEHLRALEEGWWDELPSQAYALGFLKSYARFLGLDAADMVARYRAENGHMDSDVVAPCRRLSPQPIEESRIPRTPIAVMSAVLALAGYCGWYFIEGSQYIAADSASAIPAHLAALAVPDASENVALETVYVQGVSTPAAPAVSLARVDLATITVSARHRIAMVTVPALDRRERVVAQVEPQAEPLAEPLHVASALARIGTPTLIRPAHAGIEEQARNSRITLRARTDTWILVEDAKDHAVRQGVLRAGEQYRAPDMKGLTLTTSNLNGLDVIVDGALKTLRPDDDSITRDLPLDAERLAAL
jgi:cytoskeleton protein RodZ